MDINIQEIMEAAKAKAHDQLVEATVKGLTDSLAYKTREEIEKVVAEFFAKEIQPEMARMLGEKKPDILAAISAAITASGNILAEKMMARLVKKTSEMSDYDLRKPFEAIL